MKVAVVAKSFAGTGGAENATQQIARELMAKGYQVDILIPEAEAAELGSSNMFSVVPLPNNLFFLSVGDIWFQRKLRRQVSRQLSQYDVVHFSMLHTVMALFPYFVHPNWNVTARGNDIRNPRKSSYRDLVAKSQYGIKYKGFRTTFEGELLLRLFMLQNRKRGHFISISDDMVQELISLGVPKERAHKILNGVNVRRFEKILSNTKIHLRNPACRVVYAVGRNDSIKGFYYLIDAARCLKKQNVDNIVFLVKGRSHDFLVEEAIRQGVSDYFIVPDEKLNVDRYVLECSIPDDELLPDQETVALYRMADLVVIPSIMEALSNVGLEAEAAGKPLLVSDTYGCREYIKRGTALGFEVGNAQDLADKILMILSDQEMQLRQAQARDKWRSDRGIERCIQSYINLFACR